MYKFAIFLVEAITLYELVVLTGTLGRFFEAINKLGALHITLLAPGRRQSYETAVL